MQNAIIFGANSTIAQEVINKLAIAGYNLYLLARSDLSVVVTDLKVKNPAIKVYTYHYDAENDINNKKNIFKLQ